MCIKVAGNELSTVKALMTMTLNSIIADIFDIDLDYIKLETDLYRDLHMDERQKSLLKELIHEYFDGLDINFDGLKTLNQLYQKIIQTEFEEILDEQFFPCN